MFEFNSLSEKKFLRKNICVCIKVSNFKATFHGMKFKNMERKCKSCLEYFWYDKNDESADISIGIAFFLMKTFKTPVVGLGGHYSQGKTNMAVL